MPYHVTGQFIEACDCTVVCPCWVGNPPDLGSCTGFFAWSLGEGSTIDGVDVGGHRVVSVSTHLGTRTFGATTPGSDAGVTMLFVSADTGTPEYAALVAAFTGTLGGPIADVVKVIDSPPIVAPQTATITVVPKKSVTVVAGGTPAQSVITTVIEEVVGADGCPTTLLHQTLDKTLGELGVARNTEMDIAVVDPDTAATATPTYLFDFTKTGYSASYGTFDYPAP